MNHANVVSPPRSLTAMQPFFREAAVNRETALALLEGLSATQLAWRPSEESWGLSQICGHLITITNVYLPAIDDAIERGHGDAAYSDQPFRGSTMSRLLVWYMEPPVRFRMKTPKRLQPPLSLDPLLARQQYRAVQSAFELRLERAAGLDLAHVYVHVPTLRGIAAGLGAVLAVLLAHERRHLWQATALRQHASFPSH
jgi:DinB superfamily